MGEITFPTINPVRANTPEDLKKKILALLKKDPRLVFAYIVYFKDKPWAEDVIEKAAEKYPLLALHWFPFFYEKKWASSVLENIILYNKDLFWPWAKENINKPWVRKIVQSSVNAAIWFRRKFPKTKWLEEDLGKIIINCPAAVIEEAEYFSRQPGGQETIIASVKRAPSSSIDNIEDLIKYPWLRETLLSKELWEKAAADSIFEQSSYIVDKPWAGALLTKMAPKAGFYPFRESYKFLGRPWAKQVLIEAAKNNPLHALQYLPTYSGKEWSDEVTETAAAVSPWSFVEYYEGKKPEWPLTKNSEDDEKEADQNICHYFAKCDSVYKKSKEFLERIKAGISFLESELKFPIKKNEFFKKLNWALNPRIDFSYDEEFSTDKNLFFLRKKFPELSPVLLNPSFLKQLRLFAKGRKITYINMISFARAALRTSQKSKESLSSVAKAVFSKLGSAWDQEIIGPESKLILLSHEEFRGAQDNIKAELFLKSGGKPENITAALDGLKMVGEKNQNKAEALAKIRESQSKTLIILHGHGSPENWAFARNKSDQQEHSTEGIEHTINYKELAQALKESKNPIENFNLLIEACYSYDYIANLYAYLETLGIKGRPSLVITAANKDSPSFGPTNIKLQSWLLEKLRQVIRPGEPLKVKDFFMAESNFELWRMEDPSLFIGSQEGG